MSSARLPPRPIRSPPPRGVAFRFDVEERGATRSDALRILTEHAEDSDFLVTV